MKRLTRTLVTAVTLYATTAVTAQTWSWVTESTGTGIEYGYGVATDASGNNYVGGAYINGPATFGTTTLMDIANGDGYLAKYNSSGSPLWAVRMAGTLHDRVKDVIVDGANVFVAGTYRGTITFESTNATTTSLTGGGGSDNCFIAKYNSSGVVQWALTYSGGSQPWDLAICPSQQKVFMTGDRAGDLFAACYSYSSTPVSPVWSVTCTTGGTGSYAMGIAADASGNAYMLGTYLGPATGTLSTGYTFTGTYGMLLMKIAPTGTLTWVSNIGNGSGGNETGRGLELDAAGNIYIGGQFSGTANISGTSLTCSGVYDVFVAKYSNAGSIQWARRMGGPGTTGGDLLNGFTVSPAGDSYLFTVNSDNNLVPFGCKSYPAVFGNNDNKMILAKYNTQGLMKGSAAPFLDNTPNPSCVTLDPSGNAVLTGYKVGAFSAGSTTLTTAANMFLIKVSIADELPVVATTSVNLCGLGTSAALSASGPAGSTIKWYMPSTTLVATGTSYNTPASAAYGSVTYYVSSTVAGCESEKLPITVTTNSIVTLLASADQTICVGDCATITFTNVASATLNPGGLTVSSPFTVCPTSTTTYTLSNATTTVCQVSDQVKVTVTPFVGSYDAYVYEQSPCTPYPPMSGNSKAACLTPGAIAATMPSDPNLALFRCLIGNAPGWEGAGNAGITNFSIAGSYTVEVYEADASGNRQVIGGTPAPPVFLKYGSSPTATLVLTFNTSGNGTGFDPSAGPYFSDGTADGTGSIGSGQYFRDRYAEAYYNTVGGLPGENLTAFSNVIFCVDMKQVSAFGCIASKKSYFKIANNGLLNGRGARMGTAGDETEEGAESYKSLEIYPNPTNGIVYIPLTDEDKNVQVTVTDNIGRQVMKSNNLETNHGELNMAELPAGVYFYTILKNNTSYKGKIVKH